MIQVASCSPGCARWAQRRHREPDRRTCRRSSRPSSWRCRGCSRRSTTPPQRKAARRRQGADLRRWPTDTAIAYSQALEQRRPGPAAASRRHAVFDRLVYGKVKAAFGGQLRWAVSGGAPLGARLGHFFRGVGVTVLRGLRADRDHRGHDGQHPRRHPGRHGRPAAARLRGPDRRRRRDPGPRRPRVLRLLAQPGGHRRGAGCGRLVRHRRPRLVRGRLPDHHRARPRRSS